MPLHDRVTRWFATMKSGDWPAHWGLYAPDALLLVGPQVLPRHAIESDYFDHAMRTMMERLQGTDHPELSLVGLPETKGDVVWTTVREARTGMTAKAAFAVAPDGIRGMVINPVAGQPILAQSAADLAQVPGKSPARHMYLSPLHHSFARRQWGLAGAVRALPEARFTCQGRGECCQPGRWGILVSDNEVQAATVVTKALGLPAFQTDDHVGTPTFNDPFATTARWRLSGRSDGACNQLDAAGQCGIHARLGFQPVSICQTYPLLVIGTPDGWDVTASYSCRTVCENQGALLIEQEAEIRARFWPLQHQVARIPELLPVAGGGAVPPTIPWEIYRWLETELLVALDTVREDVTAALLEGNRRFDAALGRAPRVGPVSLDTLFRTVLADLPWGETWTKGWMGGSYWEAWEAERSGQVSFVPDPDLLTRYLRSILFRKIGLDMAGIGLPWGATLLAYRMVKADACFRAWLGKRTTTSREDVLEAIRAVDGLVANQPLAQRLSASLGGTLESPGTWDALVRE